jgi:hypothetical protein
MMKGVRKIKEKILGGVIPHLNGVGATSVAL